MRPQPLRRNYKQLRNAEKSTPSDYSIPDAPPWKHSFKYTFKCGVYTVKFYSTTGMNFEDKCVNLGIIMVIGANQYAKSNQGKHIFFFHVLGLGRREERNRKHVLLVVEACAYSFF